MNILNLFKKTPKEQPPQEAQDTSAAPELEIYSGMRVEVTTFDGRLLFVAKLLGLHVRIRGYSDRERKAVYLEGRITPQPKHIWQVEELTVARIGNDRAFFRLDTDLDATATMFSGLLMGERPCKMLNISVGGACIRSENRYHEGDKFLLKVRLLEDRPESAMFCQVLRVIEKEGQPNEYGCRFLELAEDDQDKILENIFAAQRKKRGTS